MAYRTRIFFSDAQKADIWDRWRRGDSMRSIGHVFDRASSSIYPLLSRTGGIRPPERKRSRLALTPAEREEISRGLAPNPVVSHHRARPVPISRDGQPGGQPERRSSNLSCDALGSARVGLRQPPQTL